MINYRRKIREIYRSGCQSRIRESIILAEPRLKKTEESGNPKVWTAEECSQEFLRSLIPIGRRRKAEGSRQKAVGRGDQDANANSDN